MSQPKVAIIYYSMYGHIKELAHLEKEGAEKAGCKVDVFCVPETLSKEVLEKMGAPGNDEKVFSYEMMDSMPEYDGFIFGFPTRFGIMASQMKAFWDSMGGLWAKGALIGKPAAIFTSTSTQGGGTETTILTALPMLVHHGMIFVPMGYS